MPLPVYRKYRKPYRARRYRKSRYSRAPLAVKAYRMARSVKLSKELKHVDVNFGETFATHLPAAATMRFLNPIAQGTGEDQRIGRQIVAHSLQLKFTPQFSAGGNAYQKVKYMIYLHRETGGAPPDLSKVFTATNTFQTLPNLDYPKYGRILKSGMCCLDQYHGQRDIKIYLKLRFRSTWSDDTDAIADMSRNSLYFIVWSDQASANYPAITNALCRFKYSDS